MKIISLLPSATEIVFALGLGDQVAGVSFECDYPPEARTRVHVSGTALAPGLTPAEIDAEVAAATSVGAPIYTLDHDAIRRIGPDIIITQDLCRVCAVPAGAVEAALDVLGCRADVVSLDPHRLDDVIACIDTVGDATGTAAVASRLMTELHARVAAVRARVEGLARPRVLVLEWADSPFSAGHWVPDMVAAAGGDPVLGEAGAHSLRLEWRAIEAARADVVVFMPCGFDLDTAIAQSAEVVGRPELAGADAFFAVDANAYFSRPGPRVVDGVELLAELLHPTSARPVRGGWRLR
jgi:iron complex transport system substrate-binding protein